MAPILVFSLTAKLRLMVANLNGPLISEALNDILKKVVRTDVLE